MGKRFSFNLDINLTIVLIVIGILFGINYYFTMRNNNNLRTQLIEQEKLSNALMDTMRVFRNDYGEVVSEKFTIQTNFEELQEKNELLNQNQQKLLERISSLQNTNRVIAASLINTEFKLDSLIGTTVDVDSIDESLNFKDTTEHLAYDITVHNAIPAEEDISPSLMFNNLYAPNEMFIEFHWEDEKKDDYPIAFSVTNTNPLFETMNIESYAIPGLDKTTIDPSTWDKVSSWGRRNRIWLIGGAGILIGGILL